MLPLKFTSRRAPKGQRGRWPRHWTDVHRARKDHHCQVLKQLRKRSTDPHAHNALINKVTSMHLHPALGPQGNKTQPKVYAPPDCSLGSLWEWAGNVLNSISLSRKIVYVFYWNYESKDEILQHVLGSMLMGTCHVSRGRFTSVAAIQTGKISSICSGSLCAAVLHGYHVHFNFLHKCFGKGGGKPLSLSFSKGRHSLHPLLKLYRYQSPQHHKHTHVRLNPEMLILQRVCQKIYLLFRTV